MHKQKRQRDRKKYREEKCKEEEEKHCEEFEAQASLFCESVESQSSVKGETSLLRRTVVGGIDHMGRVANPETLERSPTYEYNPRNISSATQL